VSGASGGKVAKWLERVAGAGPSPGGVSGCTVRTVALSEAAVAGGAPLVHAMPGTGAQPPAHLAHDARCVGVLLVD
jgi:hypothetical protein